MPRVKSLLRVLTNSTSKHPTPLRLCQTHQQGGHSHCPPPQALDLRVKRKERCWEERNTWLILFSFPSTTSQMERVPQFSTPNLKPWSPLWLLSLTVKSPPLSLFQTPCTVLTNPSHSFNYPSWSLLPAQADSVPFPKSTLSFSKPLSTGAKSHLFCNPVLFVHSPFLNSSTAPHYLRDEIKFLIQSQPTSQLYILPLRGFANFSHFIHIRFFLLPDFTPIYFCTSIAFSCCFLTWQELFLFSAHQTPPQDGAQMSPFLEHFP